MPAETSPVSSSRDRGADGAKLVDVDVVRTERDPRRLLVPHDQPAGCVECSLPHSRVQVDGDTRERPVGRKVHAGRASR